MHATACIELNSGRVMREALRGLEGFTHIWVITVFHGNPHSKWKSLVRPPRLGGARKQGVFATRSPHRPNPIGLSAVRIERIEDEKIFLQGGDFLDGTPVLDIKPYIRYADSIPRASLGWLEEGQPKNLLKVLFVADVSRRISRYEKTGYAGLRPLLRRVLAQDPRPAFQKKKADQKGIPAHYAMKLWDFDVHWELDDRHCCKVIQLIRI